MKNRLWLLLLSGSLFACSDGSQAPLPAASPLPSRQHDEAMVRLGEAVYRSHCASCHGADAEGAADWRLRGENGWFPPPPLNGTGHAWHHSTAWLQERIRLGSEPGQGAMPAWQDKLSEAEIAAVVEWFQSRWSERAYAAWQQMQRP